MISLTSSQATLYVTAANISQSVIGGARRGRGFLPLPRKPEL